MGPSPGDPPPSVPLTVASTMPNLVLAEGWKNLGVRLPEDLVSVDRPTMTFGSTCGSAASHRLPTRAAPNREESVGTASFLRWRAETFLSSTLGGLSAMRLWAHAQTSRSCPKLRPASRAGTSSQRPSKSDPPSATRRSGQAGGLRWRPADGSSRPGELLPDLPARPPR